MEKYIQLKTSGVLQMVILNDLSKVPTFSRSGICFFGQKFKMAARGHIKIAPFEEFNIYSFVIPLFHLLFHGESFQVFFSSFKALFMFFLKKSQMDA